MSTTGMMPAIGTTGTMDVTGMMDMTVMRDANVVAIAGNSSFNAETAVVTAVFWLIRTILPLFVLLTAESIWKSEVLR